MGRSLNTLTKAAVLLAIALVFQLLKIGGQFFIGTGINAVLIIAATVCGLPWAVLIGTLTPLFAVFLGVQPPALFPVIPFIIGSNILYVALFWLVRRLNESSASVAAAAVVSAAASKFALLYTVVNFFIQVKPPIRVAMSIPQLITAVAGGAVALVVQGN